MRPRPAPRRQNPFANIRALVHTRDSKKGNTTSLMASSFRKHKKKLNILMAVVGILCLVIGMLMALGALMRHEHEQMRFFRVAGLYAIGGLALLILRYLFFRLPEIVRSHQSPSARRRRDHFQTMRRPEPAPVAREEEGSILIVVLLLLGILSALAFRVLTTARQDVAYADAVMKAGLLNVAALDSARAAMQLLADDDNLRVDHPGEPWADIPDVVDPAGINRRVRVTDLQQYFDLNNLAAAQAGLQLPVDEVLARIMVECNILTPGNQIQALRDWIDSDTTGVYEEFLYAQRTPPYQPAHRILYGMNELLLVDGWTPAMFEREVANSWLDFSNGNLIDCVTIIPAPRSGVIPVNVNTAPPDVLQGLFGVGREAAAEFVLARRKVAPIDRFDFLATQIGNETYRQLSPYLDTRSAWFNIDVTTEKDGRTARLQVVARRDDEGRVDAVRAYF